jgi:hypothetical protein
MHRWLHHLLNDIYLSRATDCVDATAFAVVEDVVRIAADVDFATTLPIPYRARRAWMEDGTRQTIDDSLHPMRSENFQRPGQFSMFDHFALFAIDYCYMARGWNIYENTLPLFSNSKASG